MREDAAEKRRRQSGRGRIVLASVILGALFLLDLYCPDRLFSETERRMLQQRPKLRGQAAEPWETLLSGSYTADYEAYLTDQFVGRDFWVRIKTSLEAAAGKKLINQVYLGADGQLFARHLARAAGGDGTLEEQAQRKLPALLAAAADLQAACPDGQVRILLAPGAGAVLPERMPPHAAAGAFSEQAFLEQGRALARDRFPDEPVWVDVMPALQAHSREPIYYKTDHHWTTLGAYYGYCAFAASMDIRPRPLEAFRRETLSAAFSGTLQARLNLPWQQDVIERFVPLAERRYELIYDQGEKESRDLYEMDYLKTGNPYGVFLDDNHALLEIRTQGADWPERSLLVIKDSYANCLIPFLTEHYGTIYVVDPRYFRADPVSFAAEQKIGDVLILYQATGFLESSAAAFPGVPAAR